MPQVWVGISGWILSCHCRFHELDKFVTSFWGSNWVFITIHIHLIDSFEFRIPRTVRFHLLQKVWLNLVCFERPHSYLNLNHHLFRLVVLFSGFWTEKKRKPQTFSPSYQNARRTYSFLIWKTQFWYRYLSLVSATSYLIFYERIVSELNSELFCFG